MKPKYKWQQIKEQYSNEQELIDLVRTKPYQELSELWDCSVDCVKTLRFKLGLSKRNISREDLSKQYTKEQLEDLYLNKFDRHLADLAKFLNCHIDTLSNLFTDLEIKQKPHHPSEYEESRQKISEKAKERAKVVNPIQNILNSPDWVDNMVKTRQENNSYQQPHPENKKVYDISDGEFFELVRFHGVLALAKMLKCSQSTIRERAHELGIELQSGPRPALAQTEKYSTQQRKNRLKQVFPTKGTSIEIKLWNELTKRNIKFEKHKTILEMTQPDVFIVPNICIYADGCYWHGCKDCMGSKELTFSKNTQNQDQYVNEGLRRNNFKVYRLWEHDIKKDVSECVDRIVELKPAN